MYWLLRRFRLDFCFSGESSSGGTSSRDAPNSGRGSASSSEKGGSGGNAFASNRKDADGSAARWNESHVSEWMDGSHACQQGASTFHQEVIKDAHRTQ